MPLKKFIGGCGPANVTEPPSVIPEDLRQAKMLWESGHKKNKKEIRNILTQYIKASFVPADVYDYEEILENGDIVGGTRIIIDVQGFQESGMPILDLTAMFQLPLNRDLTQEELEEWEMEHGYLNDGMSFMFEIPDQDYAELLLDYNNIELCIA